MDVARRATLRRNVAGNRSSELFPQRRFGKKRGRESALASVFPVGRFILRSAPRSLRHLILFREWLDADNLEQSRSYKRGDELHFARTADTTFDFVHRKGISADDFIEAAFEKSGDFQFLTGKSDNEGLSFPPDMSQYSGPHANHRFR